MELEEKLKKWIRSFEKVPIDFENPYDNVDCVMLTERQVAELKKLFENCLERIAKE